MPDSVIICPAMIKKGMAIKEILSKGSAILCTITMGGSPK
jgi:hypothetical protein